MKIKVGECVHISGVMVGSSTNIGKVRSLSPGGVRVAVSCCGDREAVFFATFKQIEKVKRAQ